jgi:hypothetical protein
MHKKYYEFQYNMLEHNSNHLYIQQKKTRTHHIKNVFIKWKTRTFINHKHEGEQHYIATCYPPHFETKCIKVRNTRKM